MQILREMLDTQGYTCVLRKDDKFYTATERGVKPLVRFLTQGPDLRNCQAADKVVGKATAYLYVLLGAREVYAHVVSRSAAQVLQSNGIEASWGTLVDNIINRQGTGICPFEEAVLAIHSPEEALIAIREKMEKMNITL